MSSSWSLTCMLVLLFALAIRKIHAREPLPSPPTNFQPLPPSRNFEVHIIKGFTNDSVAGRCSSLRHQFRANFTLVDLHDQFQWHFRLRMERHVRVVYDCVVAKGFDERKTFRAFDQATDTENRRCGRTGKCFWELKDDGIYFANDNSTWTKETGWDATFPPMDPISTPK
ncbi:uncharacterized protein LOC126678680 [Mercurialis annua]|uniref:uncharacterized protein LOC126678680 n=1 Tax=Mercurialis annua TaxID=3986 RepID=UPI00215F4B29|nr:uncharacterized protein LOC126678680 [Mercurialis annua]